MYLSESRGKERKKERKNPDSLLEFKIHAYYVAGIQKGARVAHPRRGAHRATVLFGL